MQESFSSPFIRYPIGTSLLMAGILFVGLVAYPLLPVAPLPQVDFPTIQVSASLPGGSPETMASSVAQPLERQLAQIPGIAQMTSTSSLGSASITIQFDLNRLIDAAANDVQAAINAAGGQLPKNLPSPPTYRKVNPADSPIMILSATSDTLPLTTVSDRTDAQLAQQISQIPGVAQVFVGGQQKPSVRIQVDPAKLVAKGLSLEDVRSQIAIATTDSPKGNIDGTRRAYTVYANDQLLEPAQWQDVIVAYRNGAPLRIRDIGEAVSGPEDMKTAAWADGKRGVFLVIFKQPGANVIDTVNRIKEKLPRLIAAIPSAISIKTISDRTITIRAAVEEVQITLMITIVLVVMVIFIFLRSFWATIIPSITVPLALLGACSLMWVFGYSLDNLSLMALTIAVGFVVDDAIVMLENITRYVERGENPVTAAYKGAAEIGFTIVSISISLVAVLIPLLLMGGIIGRLFREFAVTLAMAIFVSLVVSLTLTPMMASRFLRSDHEARSGRVYQWSERLFERLLGAYERGLGHALRHSLITLCIFFATVALSALLFILIPKGFFPQQDNGFLTAVSEMPQDISFAEMKRRQEELNAIVQADPAVDSIAMFIGGGGTALNSGRMYVTLKPIGERDANAQQIIARLRPKLAKVEGARLYMQASQDVRLGGRATRTQFEFTLQDANLSELNAWAPKILTEMRGLPELRDVATDQQTEGTTVQLTINRDTAARYGIQPQLIDDTLYDAFGQRQVAQYFTQTNSYHVVLEITPALQGRLDTLDKLYIKSPLTGDEVPLSVICRWNSEPVRPLAIAHQSQFPAVTISFNLAEGVALGQATAAVMRAVGEMGAPPTLSMSFQGTAQAFQQSLGTVPMLILAALVVVYLVLGVLYESYIHPLTILSTLPSAGVGAIAILMIFGFDFSLIALIGVILLIGIVKKNGIMMVDFAIAAEREQHLTPEQSIRQAALLRFRPIMMTTMAALLGGVPLMLGTGTGAEIRQPLGYAMVGGLMVSQALTLFTTPVVYLYLDRFSNTLSRWMERRPEAEEESDEQKDAAE
ncbi:efflux RND transporter permease subunit [Bradyrhizobium diazoefficiens]|uniref:efflux RND transporter permease subunit n=1 Tax=Bradyrhizobium diazoefficiens TaxID=1355477 RepID=UPI00190A17CC|nr:efflux RND transporter permease subunit [Bradyrhizobium diazoefficiens]QQO35082.1 efflux RND transporter permease subunit [Bradyrhizobium diazoefficiens]